jgi:hypothetical protein
VTGAALSLLAIVLSLLALILLLSSGHPEDPLPCPTVTIPGAPPCPPTTST